MARHPDITAKNTDDRALRRAHPVQGPPTARLIGTDRKVHRAERILGEPGAEKFLARLDQAHKG
jgi:thiol:disulfide interchange protein DsbD